jgi:hypothetical protein
MAPQALLPRRSRGPRSAHEVHKLSWPNGSHRCHRGNDVAVGHARKGMAPARAAKWRATFAGAATSAVITIERVDRDPDPENAVIAATGTGNHQTDGRFARLVDGNRQGTPIHVIDQGGVA